MKQLLLLILSLFLLTNIFAQTSPPFAGEIAGFKKQDSLAAPVKNTILFVGSSSFRLWKNIHQSFPKHTIINRGFGGSSLPDVIRYAGDIIFPYSPKQIVIYCGENDIAGSDSATGQIVYERFTQLFTMIRQQQPLVPIVYVSMKPSPSRWHLREKTKKGNLLIKNFLRSEKNTAYVDVWKAMLKKDGTPMENLFVEDKLHMNEKGYLIWQKIIEPYLLK